MSKYSFDDILIFAVNIEKNGENFYREIAEKAEDSNVSALFKFLAEEEVKHSAYFSELLNSLDSFNDGGDYPDEYFSYLRAFVDNAVFDKKNKSDAVLNIHSLVDVIDTALKMESDSIIFYNELKSFVIEEDASKIEVIITEEKKHFRKLYELKMAKLLSN